MGFNVKICDYCDTCFFTDEYEIRNGEIICVLCIDEEGEEEENKLKKNERPDN
jgi:formylmethanofuran dehydrogenase subunit E